MNYIEALEYIDSNLKGGCNPGLSRIENLLELLGNPHKAIKAVHIAGTNGKGSITAMISSILKEEGYRVGTYISPHLQSITERYLINNVEIEEDVFASYVSIIKENIDKMIAEGKEKPSQFEALTALAFLYFKDKGVDIAVVEVGLGGRYDATNVLDSLISVITSISYDHMDILGDTIEKIAFEKAGIIKRNQITILYPQRFQEAEKVIEAVCNDQKTTCIKVLPKYVTQKGFGLDGQIMDYSYNGQTFRDIKLPLLGDHQLLNAAVAITAAMKLNKLGYKISEESIRKGIKNVKWLGRLSIVSKNPFIIIDGAHNEDGIYALSKALKKYFHNKNIVMVIGMLRDKNHRDSISLLGPLASKMIATEPMSERALSAEELAEEAREHCSEVYAIPSIAQAIDKAKDIVDSNSIILICGSLYLIGEVCRIIKP
ncbi:bifunctional folylpolyglutamate synthase/dihydrofolate synthase [Lutispora thermophila]|uniref:Dihydrofolate synthase/folylpolyglutamate synthase n=1 Tax=Lutispora thermophila DSM 19022 TaxID=1122184 RepID=A0A1M6GLH3_9FIRM|nr:folylpolyglutamate synthase/dihydrofolate synthase family protein [Lutispora thermophila]SHJ10797.1 dihydrofolate synthase / folylpolyglutamate synthase [Lutispora thermophila DSM 19022]